MEAKKSKKEERYLQEALVEISQGGS